MKIITSSILAFTCAYSSAVGSPLFFDAFDTDTSSNYTGTGFSVSDGVLNMTIDSTIRNIMISNAVQFDVGSVVSLDVLNTRDLNALESLVIATDSAGSDRLFFGRGDGYLFATDGVANLIPRIDETGAAITLQMTRIASDEFSMEIIDSGTVVASHNHVDASWSLVTEFYMGARGRLEPVGTTASPLEVQFDNFSVTAVPEPSGALLLCSSLFGSFFIRKRK